MWVEPGTSGFRLHGLGKDDLTWSLVIEGRTFEAEVALRRGVTMTLQLKPGTSWWETYGRCTQAAPEAFDSDRLRNLTRGEWRRIGIPGDHVNAA